MFGVGRSDSSMNHSRLENASSETRGTPANFVDGLDHLRSPHPNIYREQDTGFLLPSKIGDGDHREWVLGLGSVRSPRLSPDGKTPFSWGGFL